MRQSASRIRALYVRYFAAEAAAFPGIRTEWPSFPYNQKPATEYKHTHERPLERVQRHANSTTRSGTA
jgi:hypothetical protein